MKDISHIPRSQRRAEMRLTWRLRVRYAIETLIAYIIYVFFRLLPVAAASATGGWILSHIGPRMGISRVARQNIVRAFPGISDTETEAIVAGMWDNLGRVIAEYPHLRHIEDRIEWAGYEHLQAMQPDAKGDTRPTVFMGGHIGNWEVAGVAAVAKGMPLHILYRKPNNPWVDRLLRYARGKAGVGYIQKGREGAREIFSLLRRGGAVGILMDQKLTEGVPVPFFGIPAMTAPAIAQFALKFDCLIYPIRVERLPRARFRLHVSPPMTVTRSDDRDADILAILTAINNQLETWIRARPADWLWIHKRWPNA